MLKDFIRGVFSEESGMPSFGRLCTGFTVVCTMSFMGAYLFFTKNFPSYDVILALAVLMTAPYGTNKVSEVITNIKDIITKKQVPVNTTSSSITSTTSSSVAPIQA